MVRQFVAQFVTGSGAPGQAQTPARPERTVRVTTLGEGRYRVAVDDGPEVVLWARQTPADADFPRRVVSWSLLPEGGGPQQRVDIEGALPDLKVALPAGEPIAVRLLDARSAAAQAGREQHSGPAGSAEGPRPVRAPMPGKVVKVLCQLRQAVRAGQGLVVIEAMKMENELRAPHDGVVSEIQVAEGQTVEGGHVVLSLGPR